MRKKLLTILLTSTLALSLMACGGDKASVSTENTAPAETTTESTAAEAEEETAEEEPAAEETTAEEATAEEATADEGFSLLDVSEDMIQAGIYAKTEAGDEEVISLFQGPDGLNYVSLMIVPADGSNGDVICGSYTENDVQITEDPDNGVDWTVITFIDAYTEEECSIVFCEGDDGSCAISNADFSVTSEGEYLDASETIDYMAAAVDFIQ